MVITKILINLAECIMALILWPDAVTDCVRPKTNTISFEEARQDKIRHWANIQADTTAGQPRWSTEVAET